jgi:hypothetical protein
MGRFMTLMVGLVLVLGIVPAQAAQTEELTRAVTAAREKGLDWLTKNQAANGSWGKTHSIAVTSFACLSYLSAGDEPFTGERGQALTKGLQFLLANQKDGTFVQQGHTWIHGQGFATLALSEAYGRSLFCKTKPDVDAQKIRDVVAQGVRVIGKHQSTSGGWWYTPGFPGQHEGSTTVCAVQALVSASNHGIEIDQKVLDLGFDYLKKCQNPDGGFDYKQGDKVSMKEGTAGCVATLGLMKKFDFPVMIKGYQFLVKITPATISGGSFPYYGHFYGCMGMHLVGDEYKEAKEFREKTGQYIAGVQKDLLAWQGKDGTWPLKGWVASSGGEDAAYATSFATLALFVPEARLSVYKRTLPKLPEGK